METLTPSNVNIKIAGAWNTRIFRPEWLIQTLDLNSNSTFEKQIGLAVNFEERDFLFQFCGISLQPTRNFIIIQLDTLKELKTRLIFPIKVVNSILHELCHTPIKGIGFNLGYTFNKNTECGFAKKLLEDTPINGFTFSQKTISKMEDGYQVNIIALFAPKTDNKLGKLEFNFHYPEKKETFFFNEKTLLNHLEYAEGVLHE
jgi:hypothetical protein